MPMVFYNNTKCVKVTIVFSDLGRYRFIVTHGAIFTKIFTQFITF